MVDPYEISVNRRHEDIGQVLTLAATYAPLEPVTLALGVPEPHCARTMDSRDSKIERKGVKAPIVNAQEITNNRFVMCPTKVRISGFPHSYILRQTTYDIRRVRHRFRRILHHSRKILSEVGRSTVRVK